MQNEMRLNAVNVASNDIAKEGGMKVKKEKTSALTRKI
jgi:hypothetical protein